MKAQLKKAGLTPAEFALILGVSRVTAYNYVSGRSKKPHPLIATRVQKALDMLSKLVEKEKLPLRADLDRDTRHGKVTKLKEIFETYSK